MEHFPVIKVVDVQRINDCSSFNRFVRFSIFSCHAKHSSSVHPFVESQQDDHLQGGKLLQSHETIASGCIGIVTVRGFFDSPLVTAVVLVDSDAHKVRERRKKGCKQLSEKDVASGGTTIAGTGFKVHYPPGDAERLQLARRDRIFLGKNSGQAEVGILLFITHMWPVVAKLGTFQDCRHGNSSLDRRGR
jgi:hypothetical protein